MSRPHATDPTGGTAPREPGEGAGAPGRPFSAEDAASLVKAFPRALARSDADLRRHASGWAGVWASARRWHLQWAVPALAPAGALLFLSLGPAPEVTAVIQVTPLAQALDGPARASASRPEEVLEGRPSQQVAVAFRTARSYLGSLQTRLLIQGGDAWRTWDVPTERRGGVLVYEGPLRGLVGDLTPGRYQIYPITDRSWRLPALKEAAARSQTARDRWALEVLPELPAPLAGGATQPD